MNEESEVYTIPLQLFCSKDSCRYFLTSPFNFGHYTYASDGRMLVRVPIIRSYSRPSDKTELKVARGARDLLEKFPKRGFIAIDLPKKKDVPKNSYGQHVVQIGASNFNLMFLLAMKRLPNLKVRPPRKPLDVILFTFDGGIGKVMPTLAQAHFTINTKQKGNKPHGTPKEKADRDAGNKRAAIHSRRKRRTT